jgi:copper chaperone CopZ
MAKMETHRLKVKGEHKIHCAGCAKSVKLGLATLPGVEMVQADHETQLIEVGADAEQTNLSRIQALLAELGYQTEPAS